MKKIISMVIAALTATAALAQIDDTSMPRSVDNRTFGQKVASGVKQTFKMIDQDVKPTGVHTQWDLYAGPKVGVNLTNITSMGGSPKVTLTGGGFIEVFLLPNLAVDMEITYSRQGTTGVDHTMTYERADGTTYEETSKGYEYSLDYINTDYLARWYPRQELPLSLYAGLHLARCVGARAKYHGGSSDIYGRIHRGDVSVPLGVGYEWGQWQVDLRYNHAIRKLPRSEQAKRIMGEARNQMLSLTVAYKILLW